MRKPRTADDQYQGYAYSAGRFRLRFHFRKSAPISVALAGRLGS